MSQVREPINLPVTEFSHIWTTMQDPFWKGCFVSGYEVQHQEDGTQSCTLKVIKATPAQEQRLLELAERSGMRVVFQSRHQGETHG